MALQYKHLDLKNRKVRIEQNLVMVTDGSGNKKRRPLIQRSVKTEAGVREIPLCDIALEAISNHIALYYTGNDEDYVFKTRTGTHLTPHNISKAVNQVFKRAKIDASGMHILRHPYVKPTTKKFASFLKFFRAAAIAARSCSIRYSWLMLPFQISPFLKSPA